MWERRTSRRCQREQLSSASHSSSIKCLPVWNPRIELQDDKTFLFAINELQSKRLFFNLEKRVIYTNHILFRLMYIHVVPVARVKGVSLKPVCRNRASSDILFARLTITAVATEGTPNPLVPRRASTSKMAPLVRYNIQLTTASCTSLLAQELADGK
mmetsp:Transcript_36328/g.81881  ORF Transcript_36328/g.81881 Transcript_36328/m.81881 type:complete len:157 (+) Transcript_36328:977-1447(+)